MKHYRITLFMFEKVTRINRGFDLHQPCKIPSVQLAYAFPWRQTLMDLILEKNVKFWAVFRKKKVPAEFPKSHLFAFGKGNVYGSSCTEHRGFNSTHLSAIFLPATPTNICRYQFSRRPCSKVCQSNLGLLLETSIVTEQRFSMSNKCEGTAETSRNPDHHFGFRFAGLGSWHEQQLPRLAVLVWLLLEI
ncbi:hypothetical protein V6N11_029893 [Hibiscus sabdariffa]|uniref:Uncharacterized protein n=2 Tax=Hibiscus sabdariffa TaxID=183260 RepID=A0ABR2PJB4_9ROSI